MDMIKMGVFLKELRKEKGITQEQFGEIMGVSSRTVSRWETGSNAPDLAVLIEISEYYNVDLKEILYGERKSEDMNSDSKETLVKVAEYVDSEKRAKSSRINKYFIAAFACITVVVLNRQFEILSYVFRENADDFVAGALSGLSLLFIFVACYDNNHDISLKNKKRALLKK